MCEHELKGWNRFISEDSNCMVLFLQTVSEVWKIFDWPSQVPDY